MDPGDHEKFVLGLCAARGAPVPEIRRSVSIRRRNMGRNGRNGEGEDGRGAHNMHGKGYGYLPYKAPSYGKVERSGSESSLDSESDGFGLDKVVSLFHVDDCVLIIYLLDG